MRLSRCARASRRKNDEEAGKEGEETAKRKEDAFELARRDAEAQEESLFGGGEGYKRGAQCHKCSVRSSLSTITQSKVKQKR